MTTPELPPLHWVGAMQIDNASFQSLATEASVEARERILQARIAELEAECERLRQAVMIQEGKASSAVFDQLDRIAALEADAERWRTLRAFHWSEAPMCVVMNPKENVRLGANCPSGDLLDAAIDAAREGK